MNTNEWSLTESKKATIDGMTYESMLALWRFAPSGNPLIMGETGEYFHNRMKALAEKTDTVSASKALGWVKK